METVHMSRNGRDRNNNRKRYNSGSRNRWPRYFKIGDIVFITIQDFRKRGKFYLCEARVIRQPTFPHGPYKLLIHGVQVASESSTDSVETFLGMRLRRKQDAVYREGRSFLVSGNGHWIKLSDEKSDGLVRQAIAFIRKEKLNQARGRNAWLITKRKRN